MGRPHANEGGGGWLGVGRRSPAGRPAPSEPAPRREVSDDAGGAGRTAPQPGQDGDGGLGAAGGAEQGAEPAERHRRRLRGGQAAQRGRGARGALPAGRRRGGRAGRGAADPLHAAAGLLLRERHQHPARQQPRAPRRAAAPPAARRRARPARRPALRARHEPLCFSVEGSSTESANVLLS